VFNGRPCIERALESLWSQTDEDFEVVVVDDASTDGTVGILNRHRDPRLKVIRLKENMGQARATTESVRAATAPLIKFLHADDMLRPACIEMCRKALTANPQVGVVCCKREIHVVPDTPAARAWREAYGDLWKSWRGFANDDGVVPGGVLLAHFLRSGASGNWIAEPSGVMVRRSVLEAIGGMHLRSTAGVDFEWWARMLTVADIQYIDTVLYDYTYSFSGAARRAVDSHGVYITSLWVCQSVASVALDPALVSLASKMRRRLIYRTVRRLCLDMVRCRARARHLLYQMARFMVLTRVFRRAGAVTTIETIAPVQHPATDRVACVGLPSARGTVHFDKGSRLS
jgi:glycosyltransferase involved in cell wall biosynthesis